MFWLISANSKIYDHASSFEHYKYIDWRQNNYRFAVNDIVYIYCTSPLSRIQYKTKVEKVDIPFPEIRDDKEYWIDLSEYEKAKSGKYMRLVLVDQVDNVNLSLNVLLDKGLAAAPQGPKKLDGELLEYINMSFTDSNQNDVYPEMINENEPVYEGLKKEITVNKYERSSIARAKCIEHQGTRCKICNMDFSEVYGSIGKGFIHIHHITPVSQIGETYKVDYKKDLIPVCPNCHAMLHKRKDDGSEMTIDELKKIIKDNRK